MTKHLTTTNYLRLAIQAVDDKMAENVVAVDMRGISITNDYAVIVDAPSVRQVQAIANELVNAVREAGSDVTRVEGLQAGQWVLVELGDVIVHIFQQEQRDFYRLERLWSDMPLVALDAYRD